MTDYAFQIEIGGEPLEDALQILRFDSDAEAIEAARRAYLEPWPDLAALAAAGAPVKIDPRDDQGAGVLTVSTPEALLGSWGFDDTGLLAWTAGDGESAPVLH